MSSAFTPESTLSRRFPKRLKLFVTVGAGIILLGVVAVFVWPKGANQSDTTSDKKPHLSEVQRALLGQTYSSAVYKLELSLPKGWVEVEKSRTDPYAVVKYQNPHVDSEGAASGHASASLSVQPADESLEDYVRRIIETSINISVTSKLVENRDIGINGQPVRLISYDIPSQSGIQGRVTQFIFIRHKNFYDLSFTALSSKWDSYKDAFAASASSFAIE